MEFVLPFIFGVALMIGAMAFVRHLPTMSIGLIAFAVYQVPLLINIIFPYTYGYPFSMGIAMLGVTLAALIIYATIIGYRPKHISVPVVRLRLWPLLLAYMAPFLFVLELAINPAIRSASDVEMRRDMLGQATALYTLATFLSGATLYCLLSGVFSASYKTFIKYGTPWLIYSACSLFTGNRQILLLGMMVIGLGFVLRKKSFWKAAKIMLIPLLLAGSLLFAIQYVRGSKTAGRQDTFFMSLFNITFKSDSWIQQSYAANTLGVTLYAYYGTQYHYLSFLINEKLINNVPVFNTFPLIYRRIDDNFGLPNSDYLRLKSIDDAQAALGYFPRSWGTMFGNFNMEFGLYSLFIYTVALGAACFLCARWLSRKSLGVLGVVSIYVGIAFGINYFIFIENAAYLFYLLAFTQWGALGGVSEESSNKRKRSGLQVARIK